jgi:hypothetical protein
MRFICPEELFLKFYSRRIASGNVGDVLKSLRDIERGLKAAESSEYFGCHHGVSSSVRSGAPFA